PLVNEPLQVRLDLARQRRRLVAVEWNVHRGPPRLQAILAGFRLSSRANWPDSGRPFPGLERPGKSPGTMTAHQIAVRGISWSRAGNRRGIVMAGEAPIKQAVKGIDDPVQDNPDPDRVKPVAEASR